MSKMHVAVIAALVLQASPALARNPVPIVDFPNQATATTSGKTPTVEQVLEAVVRATASKGWALAKTADGQYSATRLVRGKHTVVVAISIAPEQYSVVYQSSVNMSYGTLEGVPVIHPNYNAWARQLVEAIRMEVSKL